MKAQEYFLPQSPALTPYSSQLELLAVVIEGRGKRVEEAGDHVHSKAVLGRTCEPSHVSPTSLADQKVGTLELEPGQLGGS